MNESAWTLIGFAVVMVIVIAGLSMISQHYTLNIKSRTVGDGQHGTARWATKQEIQRTYEGKTSSDESHGLIERQADALATALLMPIPQIKKCFYRLCPGKSEEQLIAEMAQIFQVSKQAIQIRLESHNLL